MLAASAEEARLALAGGGGRGAASLDLQRGEKKVCRPLASCARWPPQRRSLNIARIAAAAAEAAAQSPRCTAHVRDTLPRPAQQQQPPLTHYILPCARLQLFCALCLRRSRCCFRTTNGRRRVLAAINWPGDRRAAVESASRVRLAARADRPNREDVSSLSNINEVDRGVHSTLRTRRAWDRVCVDQTHLESLCFYLGSTVFRMI